MCVVFFFFKQKTAYEMRIRDWSSDVCSSDLEVKLENASDGTLRAVISAERSETLDLLQRDARGLERALQEAGVKTDSGSLSFNLRGQGQGQEQQAEGNGRGRGDAGPRGADGPEALPVEAQAYRSSHRGSLDIRV